MVAYIYQKLLDEGVKAGQAPAKTRSARNWFRNLARQTTGVQPNTIIKTAPKIQLTRVPQVGFMYHFFYDPKMKEELPYYDRFPLVLPLKSTNNGFIGINFHYLPIALRIRLLDRLVDFSNNTKFDESTILDVNYDKVKDIKLVRPTIHRYISGRVKTDFRRIDADEFTVATLLPVARFSKAPISKVYSDSRKML